MSTNAKSANPAEVHEGASWQYRTPEGVLHLGDWGPEFCDKVNAFTINLSMDDLEVPDIPQVYLTIPQVRALIGRLEEVIEPYEDLILIDPRPTPECPTWCTVHHPDREGCHYGEITVNDIQIEVQLEPDYEAPRVDVSALNWVTSGDLTDLAEALHIAERLLSGPGQVSA